MLLFVGRGSSAGHRREEGRLAWVKGASMGGRDEDGSGEGGEAPLKEEPMGLALPEDPEYSTEDMIDKSLLSLVF